MRRSTPRLLEAYGRDRRSPENRLTELFATAAVANPEVVEPLFRELDVPFEPRIEARTMVWTGDGMQNVDLELRAVREDGSSAGRLWPSRSKRDN